ncbi:hypothetical protein DQ04_17401000 [Trypanosoma grayi]|uniref:hypothetical protein n=1 Tax=Trypanosoma grayi TaxID=71804 RepID=UPI0004F4A4AC|nr:hypothetical protein DQ04_17401000 [Trypanosoma grayi]KEG05908.1 hypothetical protein DQ04_17401000 [Trypanosoma grayi]
MMSWNGSCVKASTMTRRATMSGGTSARSASCPSALQTEEHGLTRPSALCSLGAAAAAAAAALPSARCCAASMGRNVPPAASAADFDPGDPIASSSAVWAMT